MGEPFYQALTVAQGTTLALAICQSGVLNMPELAGFEGWLLENAETDPNHKAWYVGIYSQKKRTDTILQEGDRVEIYRPLSHDPMTKRKARAKTTPKTHNATAPCHSA